MKFLGTLMIPLAASYRLNCNKQKEKQNSTNGIWFRHDEFLPGRSTMFSQSTKRCRAPEIVFDHGLRSVLVT